MVLYYGFVYFVSFSIPLTFTIKCDIKRTVYQRRLLHLLRLLHYVFAVSCDINVSHIQRASLGWVCDEPIIPCRNSSFVNSRGSHRRARISITQIPKYGTSRRSTRLTSWSFSPFVGSSSRSWSCPRAHLRTKHLGMTRATWKRKFSRSWGIAGLTTYYEDR